MTAPKGMCQCQHYGTDHIGAVVKGKGFRVNACMACECPKFERHTGGWWRHYPVREDEVEKEPRP